MAINPKLLEFLEQDQTGRKNSAGLGTLPENSAGPINPMAQLMADLANNKLDLDMDVTANPAQRIKNNLNIQADIAKNEEKPKYDTTSPMQAVRPIVNYGLGAASGTVALGESAVDTAKGIGMAVPQYAETPFAINPYGLKAPTAGVLNTKYNQFRNSEENAQNEAKVIDAYLLGKNLSAREPGKLSDRLNEKREKYDSQFDDSGFLGKTLDLVNQAAFSSGQMLPSVVAARVADVILPGSGEIAGIIPIAMTSSSSYNREAYQNMREQNAKLEAEGKQPKFSEKEMIRISGAAGLFGALIEAGGELMLGGVEGMTQNGIARIPFVKKLMETVTNPVVKTFWRGMISFTNEGSEEVIQGIASNAMKKFLYDDSQTVFAGNGQEYFDSFIVGGLMGFSGNIAPAVQNTVGFNATRNEVAKLVQAADAVTSKTEAADASVAIAAIKERNDTNIRAILDAENSLTLDENFNVTEEQATKKDIEDNRKGLIDILEWENERLDTILDVLADKNISTDIIENNKIRNGNTDVNSLRTGIEQFYEGGEAQNFQNARNERIAGEKGTEYGLNLRQAAEGETAEQRRTRLDENMAAIREYEQEHRDEIRNRKRTQRLHENAEAFKKVLEGYGIKDVVVDEDNLTFYDKKTGTVHIAASTSTDKAMNIKVGHEIGHAISNADANFVNDMISFMKGRNINVDALIENAKENYIKYLQKTENITESQAREKVDNDYAKEEVICEFLGQLNARSGILDAMAKQNQSLLRRVYNRVMDLVDKYTGNTGIARRYRQLAKDIRTVLKANGMEAGEIKDTAETAAQARIENKNKTARDSGSRSRNSAVDGNTADAAGRPGDSVSQNDTSVNTKFRLEQPVEETNSLIAVHNLKPSDLMDSIRLGGFPSPSIAIVKADEGHNDYGSVSVLFRKNTIDPKANKLNKVYGADAWTPTRQNASIEYEIDTKKKVALESKWYNDMRQYADGKISMSSIISQLGINEDTTSSPDDLAENLASRAEAKIVYAIENGISLPDPVTRAKPTKYDSGVYNAVDRILGSEKVSALVDLYDNGEDLSESEMQEIRTAVKQGFLETMPESIKTKWAEQGRLEKNLDTRVNGITDYQLIKILKEAVELTSGQYQTEIDTVATSEKIKDEISTSKAKKWFEEQIAELYKDQGIYNGKDVFTRSGKRRSFKETHDEYTLENIVKSMAAAPAKGANMFGFSGATMVATGSTNFKSIEEMHRDEGRLKKIPEEEYKEIIRDLTLRLDDIKDKILKENGQRAGFEETQAVNDSLVNASKKAVTPAQIQKELSRDGYKISDELAKNFSDLLRDASQVPTGYFEAKPQRAVGLDEVAAVVLPDNLDYEFYRKVENEGIEIAIYTEGDKQSRIDAVNSFDDIRFRADDEYMEAVESGNIREQKRMVKEAAQQNGFDTTDLYHGTPKFGFTEFNTGLIFATDNKSVAAGYGTRGYAYPREVFKKYVQDDGTDATLIKNVRNILNEEYSEVSEKQIEKTKQDILKRAKELDKKVTEIWQFGDDFPELDAENDNRLSNVLALTGDVIYEIEDAPQYGEEGKAAQDSIERFFQDYEDLREYFVDHYEDFQGETGKPIYDMVTKFELSDFAIDVKYTLLPVFDAENYLVNERGKYAEKENLRERVERVKDVGSYHLYGKLGDNPLVIDTSENGRSGYWTNIKTPEGFSKEYLNTEALAKEAKSKGYTSVVLKNLMDIAGNDYSSNVPSTVYVFFNSGDLKAADPVTYDDAGNVIPLSERFNSENQDIRYRAEDEDNVSRENISSVSREIDEYDKADEFNDFMSGVHLPNAPTNEDAVIHTTKEFGEAPPERRDANDMAMQKDSADERKRQKDRLSSMKRASDLAEEYTNNAPLPDHPTNEDTPIAVTEEFGEAPPSRRDAKTMSMEMEAAEEQERQQEKEHFLRRAEELAERFNLDNNYGIPTAPEYNGKSITEETLEGIFVPSLTVKPTVKEIVGGERVKRAEVQIMDAIREYEHEKRMIKTRARSMEAKQLNSMISSAVKKINTAVSKFIPNGVFSKYRANEKLESPDYQKNVNALTETRKRMRQIRRDLSQGGAYNYCAVWGMIEDAEKRQLMEQDHDYRLYDELYRKEQRLSELTRTAKRLDPAYKMGMDVYRRMQQFGGNPTTDQLESLINDMVQGYVDYLELEGEEIDREFFNELNSKMPEEKKAFIKEYASREGIKATKSQINMASLMVDVLEAVDGIKEKESAIRDKWSQFEKDTIKNSHKLSDLKERYESYQADIDSAHFHLDNMTPEQLAKVREDVEQKRKEFERIRLQISEEDRISARKFLENDADISSADRTSRYLRAYAVAEFILGDEENAKIEADENAVQRLENRVRTVEERSREFREEHRAEIQKYLNQGFTEDSAEIFVRRELRLKSEKEIRTNSVLGKLGYHIAKPIKDDYGISDYIMQNEEKARGIQNQINQYIRDNEVNKYVIGIAKDIADGKMTLLDVDTSPITDGMQLFQKKPRRLPTSGLTGKNLDHARVLSTLYREQNDYLSEGIKARKRAISDELSTTLDAVFADYDFEANAKASKYVGAKINDLLMHYTSPENIMYDVFRDGEIADYLTEEYITPIIKNSAEARRMTNVQTKRLNDLHLNRQESALTQIIAEYSNLKDITAAVKSREAGDPILTLGVIESFLDGNITAEYLAGRIAAAKAGKPYEGKTDRQIKNLEQKSKESVAESLDLDEDQESKIAEESRSAESDDGVEDDPEWENLIETLKRIQYEFKGENTKKVAEKCFDAAETCRELMNNMYDAFNEMYVTHGGQRMNFIKDYMPHQQPEDTKTKMNEVMKMLDMDPVTEIPTSIQGRTRDNRPYAKWLSFRQKRTGEQTVYDATGNIYRYLSAANQALYHIDDIFKLRHLETYIRNIHEREMDDYHEVVANQMMNADLIEGSNTVPKTTNTQYGRFAEWLKLYADDLAGKQVYRDMESMFGRVSLNAWSMVQRISNRTMLAFNFSSAIKQLSQMPTVAAELGKERLIDALVDTFNANNAIETKYHVLERSSFLAEKEAIEEVDYREWSDYKFGQSALSDVGSLAKELAGKLGDFLGEFDKINSRFAVYAYFQQGLDNGMTGDEALDYADRRARQINASRIRGAQPLAFRNKGFFVSLVNLYQRETVAQWENLTKYLPREFKRIEAKEGKKAAQNLFTERLIKHQIYTATFNGALALLGIGTSAMFDVTGSLIRAVFSNFKHIPGDDERDLFEKIVGAGNNLGDEVLDDLPVLSTLYELTMGDSTNRLPIYSINWRRILKFASNAKSMSELKKKLADAGSDKEVKLINELIADESQAAGENLLQFLVDAAGLLYPGGSQVRKTLQALIDIEHGGRYSRGGEAGKLQFPISKAQEIPAIFFGTSGLPQAKDYYAGNAGLSETATQVYKDLIGSGMSTEKAYDLVREVSKQKNNAEKNKTLDKLKIGMEAKSSIYMGMIASDAEKRAYDLAAYGLGGIDKAVVGLAIRDIKAESLQSDKIGKLLEAGLNNQQTEDIYMQMIAYWETDENGHRVKITDTDKYLACREAGMDIKDYLTAKKAYKEIYDKDISASQKASELYRWAKQSGEYSDRQISAITENFSYYSNVKANADSYRKYEDAGIDLDTSMEIYDSMRGKTTNASKIDTLIGLNLAKDDLRNALSATLSESTWNLVKDGLDNGMNIKNYAKVIKADADGNKRLSKDERKAAIDKIPGLTDADRSVLWIATGGSAVNNPYEGTQKKQTGFGSGLGAGFGSGFGSGFGTGFGSGFGTSSNDDDPDGFLADALNAYKK